MTATLTTLLVLVSLFLSLSPVFALNVLRFGAKPNGRTDSTRAFQKAWAWACNSARPETIEVPHGRYVLGPVTFVGPCRSWVTWRIKGTLVGPKNYEVLAKSNFWILFHTVNGITVDGGGTVDARGQWFWKCRRRTGYCSIGAKSITFMWSSNVVVNNITSMNSQTMHFGLVGCRHVALENLHIRAPSGSPNTDGIHLQSSADVKVHNAVIKTGDDCISIGPGSHNIWIEKIACGPGHGISIGSLANSLNEKGVENITVTGSVFSGTDNGVRIKSWARPSNGFVNGVVFHNLAMNNVYNPIIIDQRYCPDDQCPHQTSGVKISGIKYDNIRGTSASKLVVAFYCSSSNPCTGIKIQDIDLSYFHKPASSYCDNAHGSSTGVVIPRSCL